MLALAHASGSSWLLKPLPSELPPVSPEEIPIFLVRLCISSGEIGISLEEIGIFLKEIPKSERTIGISSRETPKSQPDSCSIWRASNERRALMPRQVVQPGEGANGLAKSTENFGTGGNARCGHKDIIARLEHHVLR